MKYTSKSMKSTISLILIFFVASAFTIQSWKKLGSRIVGFKSDWDEIMVTGQSGTFNAIKLEVAKSDVHFDRVLVVYRNKSNESLKIKKNIQAGSSTRAINLKGSNRIIRKVIFYYQTKPDSDKKAKVTLYGMR